MYKGNSTYLSNSTLPYSSCNVIIVANSEDTEDGEELESTNLFANSMPLCSGSEQIQQRQDRKQ